MLAGFARRNTGMHVVLPCCLPLAERHPEYESNAMQVWGSRGICRSAVQGTILPGITRRSILELAASRGYTVEEAPVTLEEALKADEVFTSGTAVVVSPVGSLTHQGKKVQYGEAGVGGE